MRRRELLITAGLLGCLVVAGCQKSQAKQEKPEPDTVLTAMPKAQDVTDYEEFIGRTDAMFSVELRARVTGYLDKVHFQDGDEVEKGAMLFEIDNRPYKATFDQTVATVQQGEARLVRTTADHRRAENLLKRNAIGLEEYDRIQGDYAESKANIGVARAALDMAQLNLDFTKVTAPISGRLSRRMVDPGNIVQADSTPLTSIVSLDPMYVYFDIDERTILKIRRMIGEGKMKSRTAAELPVFVGLADEDMEKDRFPHVGTINFSDNRIDAATGTLRVRGIIKNPVPRLLSPGLFVRVRIIVGTPHRAMLVSEQAIGTDQGNKFVYVIRPDPKEKEVTYFDKKQKKEVTVPKLVAVQKPVRVGSLNNGLRVIEDDPDGQGLKDTDRIVVSGLQRIRPRVAVVPMSYQDFNKANPETPVKVVGYNEDAAETTGARKIAATDPGTAPAAKAGADLPAGSMSAPAPMPASNVPVVLPTR